MDRKETCNIQAPTSVNYHFTRQCNYKCGFCFHTALNTYVLPIDDAKRGLKMLKDAGMEKINFSGGEPFLYKRGQFLGELVKYCKQELNIASVSIISNGSLITEKWMQEHAKFIDILGISCDSFIEDVNERIGRHTRGKNHLQILRKVHDWCKTYNVMFKINSVINSLNVEEDMNDAILELNPVRWKVFQCLKIEGENYGSEALRQVESFLVTDDQFQAFIDRHKDVPQLVPESNHAMTRSYLILDEYMRFLDDGTGRKAPSKSILDVGVEEAIKFSGFDEEKFLERGGKYKWSKGDVSLEW